MLIFYDTQQNVLLPVAFFIVMLNFIMLSVVILTVVMLSAVMPSHVMLSVIMPCIVMLSATTLNGMIAILSVIMMSVAHASDFLL